MKPTRVEIVDALTEGAMGIPPSPFAVDRLMALLDERWGASDDTPPFWIGGDNTPSKVVICEDCDYQEFNRLQRARREAYAGALLDWVACWKSRREAVQVACKKYPLKKRVIHEDVTLDGVRIAACFDAGQPVVRLTRNGFGYGVQVSGDVLAAAQEILEAPVTWEDDMEPEQAP